MRKCPIDDKPCRRGVIELINQTEAAELLNVSRARITQLVKSGRVDYYVIGKKILFDREKIENYADNRHKTRKEE